MASDQQLTSCLEDIHFGRAEVVVAGASPSQSDVLVKQNYQDAIIPLEVCLTEDLVKTLFPSTRKKILSVASLSPTEACVQKCVTNGTMPGYQDGLSLNMLASVSAIPSIFSPRVGNAIEESQLREWEKTKSCHNTIDCVSIEIHPQQPYNSIASKLYA
ncbi:hypothetical protein EMCG_08127 [[Emmonsia] crescens]|uniref:Uncharacterized protein n=1 Tax=[Emmonsia] crescens TaxID=73230 RepID=A0A0G2I6N3_9EURO|nr:hypothetical protein EMCG_08127 [Emmonsia crescens UAMH 3008]